MSLEDQFNAAQAKSKTLAQKPSNDVLLKLYSLFIFLVLYSWNNTPDPIIPV